MKKHFERELGKKDVVIGMKDEEIERNKEWLGEIEFWKKENEKRRDDYRDLEEEMEDKLKDKERAYKKISDDVDAVKVQMEELKKQNQAELDKQAKGFRKKLFDVEESVCLLSLFRFRSMYLWKRFQISL